MSQTWFALPLVTRAGRLSEPAHWFCFQGIQMLVRREDGPGIRCLSSADPRDIGLRAAAQQYLGTLAGRRLLFRRMRAKVPAPDGYSLVRIACAVRLVR